MPGTILVPYSAAVSSDSSQNPAENGTSTECRPPIGWGVSTHHAVVKRRGADFSVLREGRRWSDPQQEGLSGLRDEGGSEATNGH